MYSACRLNAIRISASRRQCRPLSPSRHISCTFLAPAVAVPPLHCETWGRIGARGRGAYTAAITDDRATEVRGDSATTGARRLGAAAGAGANLQCRIWLVDLG